MDEKRIKELEEKVLQLKIDSILYDEAVGKAFRGMINYRIRQLVINCCFLAYILYNIFFR